MNIILDSTPQTFQNNIDHPIVWIDKDDNIRVSGRLINYCDLYYKAILNAIKLVEEQRNSCGNCDWFKRHGEMGFDGYSEVCTAKGEFNMKEKHWDDKGCKKFKRD